MLTHVVCWIVYRYFEILEELETTFIEMGNHIFVHNNKQIAQLLSHVTLKIINCTTLILSQKYIYAGQIIINAYTMY